MTYIRIRGRSMKTKELHCAKGRCGARMKAVDQRDRVEWGFSVEGASRHAFDAFQAFSGKVADRARQSVGDQVGL